jgi:osmotically-inducible protein OsmY
MRRTCMLFAAGVGAGLMYLIDPDRGNARRAVLRDRTLHVVRSGWQGTRNSAADVANHGRGLLAELRAQMASERPSDEVLVERVRSAMGHVIRHPHKVSVTADAGWIELRGDVLPDEREALVGVIKSIPGVFGVEDHLEEYGWVNAQSVSSART